MAIVTRSGEKIHLFRCWILLLGCFALSPLPVQGAVLPESYTSFDGTLTLHYPAGWTVREDHDQIFLATHADLNRFDAPPPMPGQMRLLITPVLTQQLDLGEDVSAQDGLTFFLSAVLSDNPFSTPQNLAVNGAPAAMVMGSGALVLVLEAHHDYLIYIVGASAAGEEDTLREMALAIARSMTFAPAEVVWQVQRPVGGADSEFPPFAELSVDTDDTLYLATGAGIIQMSPSGEVLRIFANQQGQPIQNITDVVPAGDGTFWVTDSLNHQVHRLDQNGDILMSFGNFSDLSPTQIEIGISGNLYVFNSTLNEAGQNRGEIQIWNPDGDFLLAFPLAESGFAFGVRLAVDLDGNLYAADRVGGVRVFDSEGTLLIEAFAPETEPLTIAAAREDVFIASTDGRIYHFDSDGNLLGTFGSVQLPDANGFYEMFAPGEFFEPIGLVVLRDGDVVVADTNQTFAQVIRFAP